MARVRYLGPEPVTVPELGTQTIQPDQVVTVPDDRYGGYVCQPGTWQPVEEPGAAVAKKTTTSTKKEAI